MQPQRGSKVGSDMVANIDHGSSLNGLSLPSVDNLVGYVPETLDDLRCDHAHYHG
jgi:hypothetical protein